MEENRLVRQFKKSFELIKKRNWDKIYVAVDIHETLLVPTWDANNPSTEFYRHSLAAMKLMSERKDVCLILWTCSNKENTEKYLKLFNEEYGLNFKYANSNPEVSGGTYANYEDKFYVNVILDDKAGFLPEDWKFIKQYFALKKAEEVITSK